MSGWLRWTFYRFRGCELDLCGARAVRYVRTDTSKTATCEDHAGPLAELLVQMGRTVLVTPIRERNRP